MFSFPFSMAPENPPVGGAQGGFDNTTAWGREEAKVSLRGPSRRVISALASSPGDARAQSSRLGVPRVRITTDPRGGPRSGDPQENNLTLWFLTPQQNTSSNKVGEAVRQGRQRPERGGRQGVAGRNHGGLEGTVSHLS